MKKTCNFCGKELLGRSDKKFCDISCRIAYHNSHINENEKIVRTVNKILRKNRSILRFANPEGKTTVRKSFLTRQGFDFKYYTNHFTTRAGNTYTFCYDFGYLELEDEKVLIVNKQNYM